MDNILIESIPHSNEESFPSIWSKQRIIEEIAFARCRLKITDFVSDPMGKYSNKWRISSSDPEITLEMYIGPFNPTSIPDASMPHLGAWTKKSIAHDTK